MKNRIKHLELPNGLAISIYDTTRRYYEDYHLVRLQLVFEVTLKPEMFASREEFSEALELLGDTAVYEKTLEKMGVPYLEIGAARDRLLEGIENNCRGYFAAESFPHKLALTQLAEARKRRGGRRC